jgi:hypothetical protein
MATKGAEGTKGFQDHVPFVLHVAIPTRHIRQIRVIRVIRGKITPPPANGTLHACCVAVLNSFFRFR